MTAHCATTTRTMSRLARSARVWHVGPALLTALAYYAGGQTDVVPGPTTTSPAVLWPPNAVLLTALLLAPTRVWWVYLLAVLPADRAISFPLPFRYGAGLYLSNSLQSVLA